MLFDIFIQGGLLQTPSIQLFRSDKIKRDTECYLFRRLSKQIIAGKVDNTKTIFVDYRNDELLFENK